MTESRTNKNNGFFSKINKPILIITIILFIFGTLSIVSASANESISRYNYSMFHFFNKHIMMLGIGTFFGIVAMFIPTKWYRLISVVLWPVVLFMVGFLFFYGSIKRGAVNWITIPILKIQVQPSEFAKPVIILALASFFEIAAHKFKDNSLSKGMYVGIWILIGCIIPLFVILSGDLGTAAIILAISGSLYLIGPLDKQTKVKSIMVLLIGALALAGVYRLGKGYLFTNEQTQRLTEFFNPCSHYDDSGYQICNCFIAMNNGGLTGVGISKSKQKYSYIPEAYTDSIFAIIVEEDGFFVGIAIIFVYFLLLLNILKISRNSSTMRGRYIAFGVAVYLFVHIMFNLGGLLGLLPYTGVPLPLISYGGSFTISFIAALGIVQRINIETKEKA